MSLPDSNRARYPAAERRLRIGLVGAGLVADWHHIGMRLSNRWELVAGAMSSKPDTARQRGRAWLLDEDRNYLDYAEMAATEAARDDGIEAVAICTPNHTHRAIAETFMQHGIDIVCDKPVANSLDDVEALALLQRETGVVFAVSHPYVYHPMVRQAQAMVASGAIGEVQQFIVEYAQDWAAAGIDGEDEKKAWRRDPARVGRTSTTADIGTHAFQLLEQVAGLEVSELRADMHGLGPGAAGMDDTVFLNLRLSNGAPGSIWLSQVAIGTHCGLGLRLFGDRGSLAWHQETPELLHYTALEQNEQIYLRGHGRGILPAAERMLTLPRGHGEALGDAWGNLYTEIALAVEARRSARKLPDDLLALPDIHVGLRGVRFAEAAANSRDDQGAWVRL